MSGLEKRPVFCGQMPPAGLAKAPDCRACSKASALCRLRSV